MCSFCGGRLRGSDIDRLKEELPPTAVEIGTAYMAAVVSSGASELRDVQPAQDTSFTFPLEQDAARTTTAADAFVFAATPGDGTSVSDWVAYYMSDAAQNDAAARLPQFDGMPRSEDLSQTVYFSAEDWVS
ncbi:hypothetical protein AB3Y40_00895 [Yoonia sp. R2331]|uniref:hypothetical protein n=1 Tax=Yoonia sp. R2331 TaxID=3237238 RepID=UPI0034E54B9B